MKRASIFIVCAFAIIASSCETCYTCKSTGDKSKMFFPGETVTVVSGSARYNEITYTAGETFEIVEDTTKPDDNRRFEGDAEVELISNVCGSGKVHDSEIDAYEKNNWICTETTE